MEKRMISEILDSIKALTVGELIELTKECEKTFGVSAAVNTVVPGNPIPPVTPKTEFDVELTDFGKQKLKVIRAVHDITGLGLREAKAFVEGAPKVIKEGVSTEEAEALKTQFEELGAVITLK